MQHAQRAVSSVATEYCVLKHVYAALCLCAGDRAWLWHQLFNDVYLASKSAMHYSKSKHACNHHQCISNARVKSIKHVESIVSICATYLNKNILSTYGETV